MSWNDATSYCDALTQRERAAGRLLAAGLLFSAERQFGAGVLDHLAGVVLGQLLIFLIALDGLLDGRELVSRNVGPLDDFRLGKTDGHP